MKETMEERHELEFRRNVGELARVVRDLAEERHEDKKHEGSFQKCEDGLCRRAREAWRAL